MKPSNQFSRLSEFKYAPFFKLRFLTFLLVLQVFVVPIVQSNMNANYDSAAFKAWLLSGLLVLPIILGLIYWARKVFTDLFKDKIPVRHVLIVGFLIGFLKGFMTQYLANLMHIKDSFPFDEMLWRGFSGGVLGMALGFSLALKSSMQSDHRMLLTKEKEIDEMANEIGILKDEISALKSSSNDLIVSRVLGRLRNKMDFDLLNSDPAKNWKQISTALREDLATEVRHESYTLTQFIPINVKASHHWLRVFATQEIHLSPIAFSVINFAAGVATFYVDDDNWASFGQPVLNFALSIVIVSTFKKIQEKIDKPSLLFNHLLILSAVATSVSVLLLFKYLLQDQYAFAPLYVLIPWQLLLYYSISTVYTLIDFSSTRARYVEGIHQDLEDKQKILVDYHQRIRNDISTHLHGFLVSKIYKGTTQLDNFGRNQDFVNFDETLKLVLSEFTLDKFNAGFKRDLIGPEFFKACKESWDGIICIEFSGELSFPDYVHETTQLELAQVVEEIIANAHRHGAATEVSIHFSWLDKERLAITAIDNGIGIKSGYKKGLGCSLYEVASDGEWRIEGTEGFGSTLHMTITLWEHEARVEATSAEREDAVLPEGHTP